MVGKQRHCLNRFGFGKQACRPWPAVRLGCVAVRGSSRHAGHRTLRHIAGHRGCPVEPLLANTVCKKVDQVGDIRSRIIDQRRDGLPAIEWLHLGSRERHDLDAESWFDGVDLVGEQSRQPLRVANREGGAYPDRLHVAVDAVTDEVEPPRAEASLLKPQAQSADELADVSVDGLRGADRFRKGLPHLDGPGRTGSIGSLAAPTA